MGNPDSGGMGRIAHWQANGTVGTVAESNDKRIGFGVVRHRSQAGEDTYHNRPIVHPFKLSIVALRGM